MNKNIQEKLNIDMTKCRLICESTDRIVKKEFGGVTGDTAGFFIQMFEFCLVMGIWIGAMI